MTRGFKQRMILVLKCNLGAGSGMAKFFGTRGEASNHEL